MSVKSGCAEAVVVAQRLERLSLGDEELDGADIAVVGAPLEKRYPVFVCRSRRVARSDMIEHQVCAPICNTLKYVFAHIAMCNGCSKAKSRFGRTAFLTVMASVTILPKAQKVVIWISARDFRLTQKVAPSVSSSISVTRQSGTHNPSTNQSKLVRIRMLNIVRTGPFSSAKNRLTVYV